MRIIVLFTLSMILTISVVTCRRLNQQQCVELLKISARDNNLFDSWRFPCTGTVFGMNMYAHKTLYKEWSTSANVQMLDVSTNSDLRYAVENFGGDERINVNDVLIFVDGVGWGLFAHSAVVLTNKLLLFKDSYSEYVVKIKDIRGVKPFDSSLDYSFTRRWDLGDRGVSGVHPASSWSSSVAGNATWSSEPRIALCGARKDLDPILDTIVAYAHKLREKEGDDEVLLREALASLERGKELIAESKCAEGLRALQMADNNLPDLSDHQGLMSSPLYEARHCIYNLLNRQSKSTNEKNHQEL